MNGICTMCAGMIHTNSAKIASFLLIINGPNEHAQVKIYTTSTHIRTESAGVRQRQQRRIRWRIIICVRTHTHYNHDVMLGAQCVLLVANDARHSRNIQFRIHNRVPYQHILFTLNVVVRARTFA